MATKPQWPHDLPPCTGRRGSDSESPACGQSGRDLSQLALRGRCPLRALSTNDYIRRSRAEPLSALCTCSARWFLQIVSPLESPEESKGKPALLACRLHAGCCRSPILGCQKAGCCSPAWASLQRPAWPRQEADFPSVSSDNPGRAQAPMLRKGARAAQRQPLNHRLPGKRSLRSIFHH